MLLVPSGLLRYELLGPPIDVTDVCTLQISNNQLKGRISAFGSGIIKTAGLIPHESNVLLLLNDGLGAFVRRMNNNQCLPIPLRIPHQ